MRRLSIPYALYPVLEKNTNQHGGQAVTTSLEWAHLAPSLDNLTEHISNTFTTPAGQTYSTLCFHRTNDGRCFTEVSNQPSGTHTVTLAFVPGANEEFANALKFKPSYPADSFGVQYRVQHRSEKSIGEMRSGKWVAYAARALIVRFWELAEVILSFTRAYTQLNTYSVTESEYPRHSARPYRLHPHARVLHSFVLGLASVGI